MESHNYHVRPVRLNFKRYERHLSIFGNKVLSVLIKQWDKARIQNMKEYQYRQLATENKKVLTFNDNSVVDSAHTRPLIVPTLCEELYLEENSFKLNLTDEPVPEIPKSVELIKTVPKINDKDDFLHPTIVANKNIVYNIYNTHSDDDIPFVKVTPNENTSKDINWDNMLDSSLFDNKKDNKEMNLDKIFDNKFRNENITFSKTELTSWNFTNGSKNNRNKGEKRKIKKVTDSKAKKVQSDGNAEENQQKLPESRKQANKKNSFRKQNYTKAVKNWLNNIEPHHPVDEDLDNVNMDNIEQNTTRDKGNVEIIDQNEHFKKIPIATHKEKIINNTLKIAKKVVQAQLANKDGVMKFSKPKHNVDETQKYADIQENKPKDNKDQKMKKFVAPIKSQIPVKDVKYEICMINEGNIENNQDTLPKIKNNEIIIVLIYSNGFCQLNSHHTDGTCTPDGIIINNYDLFYCFKGTGKKHKETLKHLLKNNTVVCYGGRSVLLYLASHLDMEINSISMYDAKIGASLLDPDNSPVNFTDLQRLLSFTARYTIATECTLQKSAWYTSLLKECWIKLRDMLVEQSLWKVFVEIEMKLLPIVVDMERRGVCIDLVKLNSMEEVLVNRMKLVEQQCYKAAGKVFQINSAVQVRSILYDELQLDTKCNIRIRETICKGAKSTSETMLRSLVSEHPLPKLILEYRHLHKAHSTFLMGIAQHVKDGLVRPMWDQTAAATGRIASNNPNLQAIPKAPFSLVLFPEAGDDDSEQLKFRSVYVSRPEYSLLAADFKHVECRVFAHVAADTGLLHALTDSDDLFKVLAAKWLKKPEAEIHAEERERTKRLVYASLYGAGTRKLMEILNVSYQQALQVAASFNRTFPSLKSFGRNVVSRCEQTGGCLATLCGRVRRFSNITSEDFALKTHAERQAINFIVQGSAADLCKTAMILTENQMRSSSPPVDAHLVLQIHDELVWEVNDQHVVRATAIIKQAMEGCGRVCGMAATLPVAISLGKDWGNMEQYSLHTQ